MENKNGYIAFYNGDRKEIYANTLWEAKQEAIKLFKTPKSKVNLVSVVLAEKDNKEVTHIADF